MEPALKRRGHWRLGYINAKDAYDHSRGGYTTTKNLTAWPNAKISAVQRLLNRAGYTDKFGEPLNEDGILGAKTLFAAEQAFRKGAKKPSAADTPVSLYDANAVTAEPARGNAVQAEPVSFAEGIMDFFSGIFETALTAQKARDQAEMEAFKARQRDFWATGAQLYLRGIKGYNTSAWLLEHSLQDNPEDVWRGNDSRIAWLINHSSTYKNALDQAIANSNGVSIDTDLKDIAFKPIDEDEADLYYSIHKANIHVTGYKQSNGQWLINAVLTDKYDYTEFVKVMEEDAAFWEFELGAMANNAAIYSQKTGAIQPYNITVNFYTTR